MITIWVTEHPISQRVAMALKMGLGDTAVLALAASADNEKIKATPVHIGYGILRGMDRVAELCAAHGRDWFHLDLGYTNPGHFHGNYRIGYKGTQTLFDERFCGEESTPFARWRDEGEYALLCPATGFVATYYKVDDAAWLKEAEDLAKHLGLPAKLRRKGDTEPLEEALAKAACVITFNSSVGWQALQKGIACYSDVQASTVGSWHGESAKESLDALKNCDRRQLFRFMRAHELSLLEIQQGKIRDIINRYAHPIVP